jgi:hypothetical protein
MALLHTLLNSKSWFLPVEFHTKLHETDIHVTMRDNAAPELWWLPSHLSMQSCPLPNIHGPHGLPRELNPYWCPCILTDWPSSLALSLLKLLGAVHYTHEQLPKVTDLFSLRPSLFICVCLCTPATAFTFEFSFCHLTWRLTPVILAIQNAEIRSSQER